MTCSIDSFFTTLKAVLGKGIMCNNPHGFPSYFCIPKHNQGLFSYLLPSIIIGQKAYKAAECPMLQTAFISASQSNIFSIVSGHDGVRWASDFSLLPHEDSVLYVSGVYGWLHTPTELSCMQKRFLRALKIPIIFF